MEQKIPDWPVYDWEVMKIGHQAQPVFEKITPEYIADYCLSVQETNPIYLDPKAARAAGYSDVVAPPSMIYAYAPMRRWEMFNEMGFLAPEQASPPRSTPFAGSDVSLTGVPVVAGDVIASVSRLDNRWISRSGNKFVGFKITMHNQRGEHIGDYVYNIIWEYFRGQKGRSA
ncbi:MAG: MaoC family dehydratase N-terminal domain-containing protein [Chloroflexi bacterium]|nr:MaoC family dehydratase N-terminal domain-containing protein [Chloroflexota bacterium]